MSELLRVGVVGVGIMGADHAERIARRTGGARLVAVADADGARAAALAAEHDGVRSVADPLDLVAADDVEAVVLASPGFAHEEQVLACIEHRKPVLCEKPLTLDPVSALRLVRAEQAAGANLVSVGFMRRFDPEYAELRRVISSGELGQPLVLHNLHRNLTVAPGFTTEMVIRDSLVHEVDVARFLLGQEIAAIEVRAPRSTSLGIPGVLDPQLAMFEMAGGALVDTEVFVRSTVGYEVRCEAVLERGNVTIGMGSGPFTRSGARWGGAVPGDFRVRFQQAYDLELQGWVDATRAGRVCGADAYDGYAAVAVCEAGVAALDSGRMVQVQLAARDESRDAVAHNAAAGDDGPEEAAGSRSTSDRR